MTDTKTLIEWAYSAFNKRYIDGVLALMTEDVSWPKASEGGKVIGKAAIRAYWTRQWSEFDPHVSPLQITEEGGGKIRVRVHQLVKNLQGDVLADSEVLHVFTVQDGLIAAMDIGDETNATGGPSTAFSHTQPANLGEQSDDVPTYLTGNANSFWLVEHPCSTEDQLAMAALRVVVEPNKGKLQGVGARVPFTAIMERVAAPDVIDYEEDQIGGVPGWWCKPTGASQEHAVIHIHGGWFNWGSAQAFRHLAGHIAAHAAAAVFVPDYRLAPEHPFPAAIDDVLACYLGLLDRGYFKIAVTGDSAGGDLALGLLAYLARNVDPGAKALVGGVAISPVTDLTLSGESWLSRAQADPLFTKPQAAGLVDAYLAGHIADDPAASPLFADLKGLVPIRVHVGSDEVLLADSVRFVGKAVAAGVDAHLDVWDGMIHGFLGNVGMLEASKGALQLMGKFLKKQFTDQELA